jgi:hypothetical protein
MAAVTNAETGIKIYGAITLIYPRFRSGFMLMNNGEP